jgi:hypothetical protein
MWKDHLASLPENSRGKGPKDRKILNRSKEGSEKDLGLKKVTKKKKRYVSPINQICRKKILPTSSLGFNSAESKKSKTSIDLSVVICDKQKNSVQVDSYMKVSKAK